MKYQYVLSILDSALQEDVGIMVQAGSPKTFRQYCWNARREYESHIGDGRYDDLIIRLAPDDPENCVVILHKKALENAKADAEES